ncbi:MAG: YdcF family protein [Clostridiales bacterium]|jgi:uncharacterized SAM-binding protein YcdF (DUF218 family)|nr:YdcF family protein [Clostridiales bacterium]
MNQKTAKQLILNKGSLIVSGSKVLSFNYEFEQKTLPSVVRWILTAISALCLLNGFYYLVFLTPSLSHLIPMFIGFAIALFLLMEKQALSFLHTKHGMITAYVIAALIGVNLVVFLIFAVFTLSVSFRSPEAGADAVIILGSAIQGEKILPPLQARLDTALEYIRKSPDTLIVVSGGQGRGESITEATAMRQYLIQKGVSSAKIIEETHSTSTEENFLFSLELLKEHVGTNAEYKTVLVTNRFHAYRALKYAAKAGFNAECLSAPSKPFYLLPNNYFREYLAVIEYWLFRR